MAFDSLYVSSNTTAVDYLTGAFVCAGGIAAQQPSYLGDLSVGSFSVRPAGQVLIYNTRDASYGTGAVVCAGGVSIAKSLYVGGSIHTPVLTSPLITTTTINAAAANLMAANITSANITSAAEAYSTSTGSLIAAGGIGIAKSAFIGGRLNVTNTTPSVSLSTGCAAFSGGVAIQGNVNIAQSVNSTAALIGDVSINRSTIFAPETMTISAIGEIALTHNNKTPLGIATVGQLQLSAAGITPYEAAATISKEALPATYAAGVLTATALGGIPEINGYQPVANDRIIVNAQTNPKQNGIYTVSVVGDDNTAWYLTRADDFNSIANINANAVVTAIKGNGNGITYILLGSGPFTPDVTPIEFTQFISIPSPTFVGRSQISGGFGTRDVCQIDAGDTIGTAFDKVSAIIDKLAPASPLRLDAYSAEFPFTLLQPTYAAYNARTHQLATVVVNNVSPSIVDSKTGFGSSIAGLIYAYSTDTTQIMVGVVDMTTRLSSATITNGNLAATRIPFSVIETSVVLSLNDTGSIVFDPSNTRLRSYSFKSVDVLVRLSNVVSFYVDNAYLTTPQITAASVVSTTIGRYVSGIRVLGDNDTITLQVTAANCVGLFYNVNWIVRIDGQSVIPVTVLPNRPAAGSVTATIVVAVAKNAYEANSILSIVCQNSANVQSAPYIFTNALPIRIDSASLNMTMSESMRIAAGTGTFPTLGNPFISANSIANTAELQLVNGAYQYPPSVNYANNYLPSLNYTNLTGTRYAAFLFPGMLVEVISFDIIIYTPDITQWANDITQPTNEFTLQIKVGSSALYDANSVFNYVTPMQNGDPCLDSVKSTILTKHITFGFRPKTGDLIVRFGFPAGSQKAISNIEVANIVQ
jgi:hypothetical protein